MDGAARQTISCKALSDADILNALLRRRWGETLMMFGRCWKPGEYQAIGAFDSQGDVVGLLTYALHKSTMLVFTLDNFTDRPGIGSALLARISDIGRSEGARALRVMTTNDNTPALRYFQVRGFRMAALYPGAIAVYRLVTPTLPEIGVDGIPVRDAIELEMDL